MGRCKNPGHRRWRIRKRDGVWQAFDPDGDLRYAADLHRMVLAFVLTQPKPDPEYFILDATEAAKYFDHNHPDSIAEVIRRHIENRKRTEEEGEE